MFDQTALDLRCRAHFERVDSPRAGRVASPLESIHPSTRLLRRQLARVLVALAARLAAEPPGSSTVASQSSQAPVA